MSSKTTFQERFERTSKFYDNIYHHHKATFKGLAEFFKNYYSIEKEYANSLIKLSSAIDTCIVDFSTELPFIQQGIRQICGNIAQVSQLHFNYGERMSEISDYFKQEYANCKREKQKFMKLRVEKSQEEHTKVKESKNRLMLNEKQKEICRSLYEGLDQYLQAETLRTQKLKEQMVIYFSVTKRIAEKSLELNGTYAVKMAQEDIQIRVPQLSEIEDMLIDQFNAYGEEKLAKKIREISQQVTINRESLKDSILKRERQSRVEDSQTKIFKLNEKYQQIPEELNYPKEEEHTLGLFDVKLIPNYRVYGREFKSEIVRELAFAWLSSFYQAGDEEIQSLLTVVKTNLKIKSVQVSKVGNMQQFYEAYSALSEDYRWTLLFLGQLSAVYDGRLTLQQFDQSIRNRKVVPAATTKCIQRALHWKILLVFVDSLLDSTVIIRQGFSLLYDEYIDILKVIIKFAKEMLSIDASVVLLLLLRKLQRVFTVTNSPDEEPIEQILQQNFVLSDEFMQTEPLKLQFGHRLIHFLTSRMTVFYKCKVAFSNLVKMSLILEKVMPKNYFSAVEHMHKCIKIAGYNFFVQSDEDHKLVEMGIWRGEERLKNLTEVLEQAEYNQILQFYIAPMATQLSKLLGVGMEVVSGKMMREFSLPMHELTQAHLNILCEQQGVDKEGYALRLGICLAEYDISQPQEIDYYDAYFKVLQTYLTLTEKDYNDMLEHSRKTELWIVSENSQATQNCIDFCSLLYKPFEFLLTSLKKLQEGKVQTEFTTKYTDFIKLRLNGVLKSQIEKYVKFLSDSLSGFQSKEPEISLKPKKYAQVLAISVEDLNKQRYSFKEMSRRLYNLLFLKEQLDEIVSDFIDKAVYAQMKCSIFNLQALQLAAGREKTQKELLGNIYQIASLIVKSEERLVREMAAITIFHFMRRLFTNLYFQEEKGFFATKEDYKLSDLTFLKSESQIEETLINISRNLPAQNFQAYARQFCLYFFKAYRCELLNPYKFKIPIGAEAMTNHLKSDLAFVCTCIKQKFTDAAMVRDELQEPAKKVFKDLEKPSQRLMESFSEATNKNNNEEARYFLALLNLRRDEKAEEYVQKYKKVLK